MEVPSGERPDQPDEVGISVTKEKLWKIVRNSLARSPGAPPDQQASAVVHAISVIMEAEALDEGTAPATPEEGIIDWPLDIPIRGGLPPSPAVGLNFPSKSLIILPGSQEDQDAQAIQKKTEVTAIRPLGIIHNPVAKEDMTPKWAAYDLSAEIHRLTPEKITIQVDHPKHGRVPVTLVRNVECGPGFDAVKLSYSHPAVSGSVLDGDHAVIGLAVAKTFWCYEERIDVSGAMRQLEADATELYRPKEKYITSKTPRRVGEMTYQLGNTPHDPAEEYKPQN